MSSDDISEPSRPDQPWSDTARAARAPVRVGETLRRRKVARFGAHLEDIVVREQEETAAHDGVLNGLFRLLWPAFVVAASAGVQWVVRGTTWTATQFVAGVVVAVLLGIVLAKVLPRRRRKADGDAVTD